MTAKIFARAGKHVAGCNQWGNRGQDRYSEVGAKSIEYDTYLINLLLQRIHVLRLVRRNNHECKKRNKVIYR